MTTTVRLLATYDGSPPQTIRDLPDALAASFVAAGNASLNLTGGVRRYQSAAPLARASTQTLVGSTIARPNQQIESIVPEGVLLLVTPAAGTVGIANMVDSAGSVTQTWAVGSAAFLIGPFIGAATIRITCDVGSITLAAQGASAQAAQVAQDSTGALGVALPGGGTTAWWKKTYRSIMGLGDSIMAQGAHMPHTPVGRATRDLFPTLTNLNNGKLFVLPMEAGPATVAGNGTLKFYVADSTMTWAAFGDTEGPRVVIDTTKCFYTLESATAGNTLYIGVSPSKKPNSDRSDTVNITGAFRLRNNCGTFGQFAWTAALMAAPFDISYAYAIPTIKASDWWAARSQWQNVYTDLTYINLGTNDITSLATAIQAATDVENIAKLRQGIGSQVVISGLLPYTGAAAGVNAAMMHFNGLVRAAARRLNCDFIDPYPYLVDPVGTGGYLTGMSGDGLHPSALGGYVWASKCNTPVLSKYTRSTDQRSFPGVLYDATTSPQGNLLSNGLLTGVAGSAQTGASGEVPTNWTLTRESGSTVTAVSTAPQSSSPIPRTDGKPGNWWRIAMSNNNASNVAGEGFRARLAAFITTNYVPGEYIVLEGDLRISGAGIRALEVAWTSEGKICQAVSSYSATGYGPGDLKGDTVAISFRSPPMIVDPISQGLMPFIFVTLDSGGTCVLDIGQTISLHKVPAP